MYNKGACKRYSYALVIIPHELVVSFIVKSRIISPESDQTILHLSPNNLYDIAIDDGFAFIYFEFTLSSFN